MSPLAYAVEQFLRTEFTEVAAGSGRADVGNQAELGGGVGTAVHEGAEHRHARRFGKGGGELGERLVGHGSDCLVILLVLFERRGVCAEYCFQSFNVLWKLAIDYRIFGEA